MRIIDQIRASKLPSNMMQFAAKGALSVPPDENIEILVYLARHNKVFGDIARMTLAGWDEKASLTAVSSPQTAHEVLEYFLAPENLRPKLLPALIENTSVSESDLVKFSVAASRESIDVMLNSARVQNSPAILNSMWANPYLKTEETSKVAKLLHDTGVANPNSQAEKDDLRLPGITSSATTSQVETQDFSPEPENGGGDATVSEYLAENAAEIASEKNKPFQAVGGMVELLGADYFPVVENKGIADIHGEVNDEPAKKDSAPSAAAVAAKRAVAKSNPQDRDNTMQKIAKLDVKGRIQLALKGNKEERALLIRDGTKVVALAVLEAPKLSDGEVEKFALQKNVLEAVLRQIPLKRRFMKNYVVVRNLVANPRTPLDLSLGLMKHLQTQDLKNLSSNKEVSETVRKLAMKMFKQKVDAANKK